MGEAKNIYFTCLKYKIEKLLFLSRETWARRKFFGRCRCSGVRRRRRPWPTQKWQRPDQGQWPTSPSRRTAHAPSKVGGARAAVGQGPLLGGGHSRSRQRRRSHRSSLRHSSSHFQVFGGLLSEIRGRSFEEGDQGYPDRLRPLAARRRSPQKRAQEVRRSRSPSPTPEVLPLSRENKDLLTRRGS